MTRARGENLTIWNMLAGIGYLIGPLIAALSTFGSSILLLGAIINRLSRRPRFHPREQEILWSIGGLLLGTSMWFTLRMTHEYPEQIGFVFPMSISSMGFVLGLSVLLLAAALVINGKAREQW